MIKKYFAMTIIAASVSLAACSDDDDDVDIEGASTPLEAIDSGGTVYDTMAESSDYKTLRDGFQSSPELEDMLNDPEGFFTVFAPTDAAFDALSPADDFANTADLHSSEAVLTRILQGHVISTLTTTAEVVAREGGNAIIGTYITDSSLAFAETATDHAAISYSDVTGAAEEMWILVSDSSDNAYRSQSIARLNLSMPHIIQLDDVAGLAEKFAGYDPATVFYVACDTAVVSHAGTFWSISVDDTTQHSIAFVRGHDVDELESVFVSTMPESAFSTTQEV